MARLDISRATAQMQGVAMAVVEVVVTHTTAEATVGYHLPGSLTLLAEIWDHSRQTCIKCSYILRITYSIDFPQHSLPYLSDLCISQFHGGPPREQCIISGAKGMDSKSIVYLHA